jgi:hypothetical protein
MLNPVIAALATPTAAVNTFAAEFSALRQAQGAPSLPRGGAK